MKYENVKYDFSRNTFLVAGASSGIGRQVAIDLAKAGAFVLAMARSEKRLIDLHNQYPNNIYIEVADVCNYTQVLNALKSFVDNKKQKFNGMVYTAGVSVDSPIRKYNEDLAKKMMDVNFWAAMNLVGLFNKRVYSNEGASTILISSASAYIGEKGLFAYSASKSAMQVAVKTIAKEIAKRGNRINTLSPGWVRTDMTEDLYDDVSREIFSRHLLGLGNPDDVSSLALYLLSDCARWITGQDYVIDGGYLLGGI